MLPIFINIILTINVIVCLLLILLTLMQRPKNEGLGSAFGGGMTENLFGAQTTNVLAKATRILGGLFFGLTLLLSVLYTRQASSPSAVQAHLASKPTPAPTATPTQEEIDKTVKETLLKRLQENLAKPEAAPSPAATAVATPAASATPAPK